MILTDFRDDDFEIEESEIVEILKSIYEGYPKMSAIYHGASLCITYPTDSHPKGKENYLLNFEVQRHISEKINYWTSKIYVKNKTNGHSEWNAAKTIIKNFEGRN